MIVETKLPGQIFEAGSNESKKLKLKRNDEKALHFNLIFGPRLSISLWKAPVVKSHGAFLRQLVARNSDEEKSYFRRFFPFSTPEPPQGFSIRFSLFHSTLNFNLLFGTERNFIVFKQSSRAARDMKKLLPFANFELRHFAKIKFASDIYTKAMVSLSCVGIRLLINRTDRA